MIVTLRLSQVGLRLHQFEAQPVAIQAGKDLFASYLIAFLDQDLTDFAGNFGDDASLSIRLDGCRSGIHRIDISAGRGGGLYGNGWGVVFGILGL